MMNKQLSIQLLINYLISVILILIVLIILINCIIMLKEIPQSIHVCIQCAFIIIILHITLFRLLISLFEALHVEYPYSNCMTCKSCVYYAWQIEPQAVHVERFIFSLCSPS